MSTIPPLPYNFANNTPADANQVDANFDLVWGYLDALYTPTVTPGTYGDANNAVQVTVNNRGQITTITEVAIANQKTVFVRAETGAYDFNDTTIIPFDNTKPQDTEGKQFLTAAITPRATGNKIRVKALLNCSASVASYLIGALFKTGSADAVDAAAVNQTATISQILLSYEMTAPSTSAITFTVRGGLDRAGTFNLNGDSAGNPLFNGVYLSWLEIEEVPV